MKPLHSIRAFSWAMALSIFIQPLCYAWDQHQQIMELMLDMQDPALRTYLKEMIEVPSETEQKKEIELLAKELQLNPEKITIQKPGKLTIQAMVVGDTVDEPDFGMDQDLPESVDGSADRDWMGGKTGPTSQGFRHMVFPGIEWGSPLRTLQIPTRSIGQAPERILKLQEISKKYFSSNRHYWGLRILLWELHLIQDLHQPFHVMQVPYFKMLPWNNLFSKFVPRSTQVIANYHYAYEGLISESFAESVLSSLSPCMQQEKPIALDRQLIQETISFARKSAETIGAPLHALWDEEMKDPEVNLPEGLGGVDYYSYLHANPEEDDQKQKVEQVKTLLDETCVLMKRLTTVTLSELDQALQSGGK
jgi:hypothetical protein